MKGNVMLGEGIFAAFSVTALVLMVIAQALIFATSKTKKETIINMIIFFIIVVIVLFIFCSHH